MTKCDCGNTKDYHCGCVRCPKHGWLNDCRYWLPHFGADAREAFCWAWEERQAEKVWEEDR